MPGPRLLTNIVEVFVFRRVPRPSGPAGLADIEFLQIRRTRDPMAGAWNTVMGHVEEGETAMQAAVRELREETGYAKQGTGGRELLNLWQLEIVNTYFLASLDAVMLSPGFAAEVAVGPDPILDEAHDAFRWVPRDHAGRSFLWPGQKAAAEHIVNDLLSPDSPAAERLRLAF